MRGATRRGRLPGLRLGILSALLLIGNGAGLAQGRRDPCAGPRGPDAIAGVGEHGALSLASGRVALLSDLRLADAAVSHLDALRGVAVTVAQRGEGGDRWGRIRAEIRLADGRDLAADLVGRGLAWVDAGPADRLCRPDYLDLERRARSVRAGLWGQAQERPRFARDVPALRDRIGRFTLVEGRVLSTGERGPRTYLNFGTDWNSDFTVVVPQRIWQRMPSIAAGATSLKGRRIRVRGIIEDWRGPSIEVSAADSIEVLRPRRLRP